MRIGMRLLTAGRLSVADLVTHRFPLSEIDQAFQIAHDKPVGFVKSTVVLNH
jgi:threonine dehydrogenase-like Zn-dependent dehydrogenase